jgi:osmotically-inducible protein OsmY
MGCSHEDDHPRHRAGSAARSSGDEHVTRTDPADSDADEAHATAEPVDASPTAMDQGNSATDLEITRQIRASVVADSTLSMSARNCTIVTNNGRVWLRGEVTAEERTAIERHATDVGGVMAVHDDLRIAQE